MSFGFGFYGSYCFTIELHGAAEEGGSSLWCFEASEDLNLALIIVLILQIIATKIMNT